MVAKGWFFAANALFVVVVVLAFGTLTLKNRVAVLEAELQNRPKQIDPHLVNKVSDTVISDKVLLKLGAGKAFEEADAHERRELIRKWCKANMASMWNDLNPDQQELLLYRTESQLDDLLAEREF